MTTLMGETTVGSNPGLGSGALAFASGFTSAQILALSVDVYLFRHFEPAWGPGWSLQVLVALALVSAVLGALIFAVGRFAIRLPFQLPGPLRPSRFLLVGAVVGLLLVCESHLSARLFGFASSLAHAVDIGCFVAFSLSAGVLASSNECRRRTA